MKELIGDWEVTSEAGEFEPALVSLGPNTLAGASRSAMWGGEWHCSGVFVAVTAKVSMMPSRSTHSPSPDLRDFRLEGFLDIRRLNRLEGVLRVVERPGVSVPVVISRVAGR